MNKSPARAKVLVAEDDPIALMLLQKGIEGAAYSVTTAGSGQETLDHLARESFDVVLTDISMPPPNGIELTKIIRAKYPRTGVIVLTASATMDTVVNALKAGAYAYLTKPFELALVKATLKRCLEKRALDGQLAQLAAAVKGLQERVSLLKRQVAGAHFGPEHESCREFAHKILAEMESRLAGLPTDGPKG